MVEILDSGQHKQVLMAPGSSIRVEVSGVGSFNIELTQDTFDIVRESDSRVMLSAQKEHDDTWTQITPRLDTKVKELEEVLRKTRELRALIRSDKVQQQLETDSELQEHSNRGHKLEGLDMMLKDIIDELS